MKLYTVVNPARSHFKNHVYNEDYFVRSKDRKILMHGKFWKGGQNGVGT